jgi:sec-independent protein translocase protein TatA
VFNLGASEIAVILIVGLIFLGPKMLPEIATGLGKIIREFRKATADIRQDIDLDDIIRKPLQELRDAATLPPEELKRRDEVKAAQRKADLAAKQEEQRRKREAEEAWRKGRDDQAAFEDTAKRQREMEQAAAAVAAVLPPSPAELITPGGTMVANPPPPVDVESITPTPVDLTTPVPAAIAAPRLPPPLPRPGRLTASSQEAVPEDATVIDLHAQLKASADAQSTLAGRPVPVAAHAAPAPSRPHPDGSKPGKKG